MTHHDPTIIDQFYLDHLRSTKPVTATGKLTRFRMDAGPRQDVVHETLSETFFELPRIHYRYYAGRPYRYVYGAGNEGSGDFIDNLVKLDIKEKQVASWYEEGCYPGEPVFVAVPDASAEDDGIILSVVLDVRKMRSFLLILEASGYKELARAEVPHHIPFGFHGNYLAETKGPQSFLTLHR